ncbi:MAG TPA: hypothetical protein VIN72_02120 [Lutibacter sp.]
MTLALLISLLSCKYNEIKEPVKQPIEQPIEQQNNQKRIGSEEWKKEAELFLSLEEGDTAFVIKNNLKKIENNISYSTNDIEYSDEWKVRAYKATKEHLRKIIPKSLPNCYINSFGYYEPYNIKYIGNNTFKVKIYLTIKCGNDDYENRKYFWFETGYSEYSNQFEFYFIKERFAN